MMKPLRMVARVEAQDATNTSLATEKSIIRTSSAIGNVRLIYSLAEKFTRTYVWAWRLWASPGDGKSVSSDLTLYPKTRPSRPAAMIAIGVVTTAVGTINF